MIRLAHGDAEVVIDPAVGNIPAWRVSGRIPLHVAPWLDEAQVQDDTNLALVNRRLAGDFFCMPFGVDDVEGDPIHGLPANTPWDVIEQDASRARLRLRAQPRGAQVTKDVALVGPCLLQTHVIEGGQGDVTLAHHPMARMAEGGRMSFSPKRAALSDPVAQHKGYNLWKINQLRSKLNVECEDGSQWDLRDYPAAHRVEDFAILVEARGRDLGWTVLMRNAEDDMLIVLKDARVMPITMLWISNGARDFPPWNSRHTGVLGIEDGRAAGGIGLRAAMQPSRVSALGVPTTLALGGRNEVRHAMVSLPRPPGWRDVATLDVSAQELIMTEVSGARLSIPFPGAHFGIGGGR